MKTEEEKRRETLQAVEGLASFAFGLFVRGVDVAARFVRKVREEPKR